MYPYEVLRSGFATTMYYWFGNTGFGIELPADPSGQIEPICPPAEDTNRLASFCLSRDSVELIDDKPIIKFCEPSKSSFSFGICHGEKVIHMTMPGKDDPAQAHLDDEEPMDWQDIETETFVQPQLNDIYTCSAQINQFVNINSNVNQFAEVYTGYYQPPPEPSIPYDRYHREQFFHTEMPRLETLGST